MRDRFGAFYAALFDRTTSSATRGAVVTEYAWDAAICDPCPALDARRRTTSRRSAPTSSPAARSQARRLRADAAARALRQGHVTDDLVFKQADADRRRPRAVGDGATARGRRDAGDATNNFQARYAIRHQWTGADHVREPAARRAGAARRTAAQPTSAIAGDRPRVRAARRDLALAREQDVPERIVAAARASGAAPPAARGGGCARLPAATSGGGLARLRSRSACLGCSIAHAEATTIRRRRDDESRLLAVGAARCWPSARGAAHAFCGFYVSGSGDEAVATTRPRSC